MAVTLVDTLAAVTLVVVTPAVVVVETVDTNTKHLHLTPTHE